jgi:hypothetical protein
MSIFSIISKISKPKFNLQCSLILDQREKKEKRAVILKQ